MALYCLSSVDVLMVELCPMKTDYETLKKLLCEYSLFWFLSWFLISMPIAVPLLTFKSLVVAAVILHNKLSTHWSIALQHSACFLLYVAPWD